MSSISVFDDKKSARKESLESAYSSNSRLNLLTKRKRMPLGEMSGGRPDKFVTQRVLSAKAHRVKQLQNQLNDAHIHLQELSNENRMLRAMQRKQEAALARYENSNAELPSMLISHEEELRIQQSKFKQLKQQHKEVTQKLKEKEMQLQQLRDEHQHLLELSKDRNLLEREKLQNQVSELSAKVQQQNETISSLQRRIALEAKNFKHQLQNEINKHKDTRHDLDLAISHTDKLTSIIEMKEKLLSTTAGRRPKSPSKPSETRGGVQREPSSTTPRKLQAKASKIFSEREKASDYSNMDNLTKLANESRDALSALSQDQVPDSPPPVEPPRHRFNKNRASSSTSRATTNSSRRSSKGSDEVSDMAKTVQNGMAELTLFDDSMEINDLTPEEYKGRIEDMKKDLLRKIKSDDSFMKADTLVKKHSALRRGSTEESIEEEIEDEQPKPRETKARRNSTVSFSKEAVEEHALVLYDHRGGHGDEIENPRGKRENMFQGKPVTEKYCSTLLHDIEKSTKIIDKHVRHFNNNKLEGEKLVQQLQNVDKLNDFVNFDTEITQETMAELNNNFKMLTENDSEIQLSNKRGVVARRGSSRSESRSSVLGDSNLSNQDLLDDLLGRK